MSVTKLLTNIMNIICVRVAVIVRTIIYIMFLIEISAFRAESSVKKIGSLSR